MRYLYHCCLLATLMCTLSVGAQAQLSLTTISTSSTTPAINTQLSILTKLKNVSLTDTFSGPVDFLLANQDSIIYDINIVGKPAFAGTTITLAPQEERSALFTVQLDPSHFKAGPDIIIVWPVAAIHIADSARAPIVIQPALGIASGQIQSAAYCIGGSFVIRAEAAIAKVDIYNMMGQCVDSYTISGTAATVPVHHLPEGTYIADITMGSGEALRIRFIR